MNYYKTLIIWILFASCSHSPRPFIPPQPFKIADGTPFIVLGDWGRRGSAGQIEVANAMAHIAQTFDVEFIISTGDNFYNRGVKSLEDAHWKESFESVYSHTALTVPWYISLGNHDHFGNVHAQIEYSKISDRWILPAPYYSKIIDTQDNGTLHFLAVDTNPMKKNNKSVFEQYEWLDEALDASDNDWTFIVGHHPIRTGGKHGETTNIIKNLKPMIDEHDVDVYFAGHDHDLQLLKDLNTHYVISGAGSKIRKVTNTPYTLFSRSSLGFVLGTISKDKLHLYFINEQAQLLYAHTIEK